MSAAHAPAPTTTPAASSGLIERVRAALLAAGHPDTIRSYPEGTRSAADAAAAVGCTVGQIAKSLVFRLAGSGRPVLVIASGANRVDLAKLGAALGAAVKRADAGWVRETTGFAIGGVAPVGHLTAPRVLIDRALAEFARIWAAAGSPQTVFETSAESLVRLTGGALADIAEDAPPAPGA